jgi:hypothetical protein
MAEEAKYAPIAILSIHVFTILPLKFKGYTAEN